MTTATMTSIETAGQVWADEVRELARRRNAVILAHNHPSGVAEHSPADRSLTRKLADALALVDVRVLDHFIVAGASSLSFMESGQL